TKVLPTAWLEISLEPRLLRSFGERTHEELPVSLEDTIRAGSSERSTNRTTAPALRPLVSGEAPKRSAAGRRPSGGRRFRHLFVLRVRLDNLHRHGWRGRTDDSLFRPKAPDLPGRRAA